MEENETLEFKKSISEMKEAIISIAAILNKHKEGKLMDLQREGIGRLLIIYTRFSLFLISFNMLSIYFLGVSVSLVLRLFCRVYSYLFLITI